MLLPGTYCRWAIYGEGQFRVGIRSAAVYLHYLRVHPGMHYLLAIPVMYIVLVKHYYTRHPLFTDMTLTHTLLYTWHVTYGYMDTGRVRVRVSLGLASVPPLSTCIRRPCHLRPPLLSSAHSVPT